MLTGSPLIFKMTTNENFNSEPHEEQRNQPDQSYLGNIGLMDHYSQEYSLRFLPRVDYYRLNVDQTTVDDLRNEVEEKIYFDKVTVPVNYEKNPTEKILNQFGIQHNRDLQVKISTAVLNQFNLNPKMGDILEVEGAGYKVTELQKENYFAGSDQPLSFILFCNKENINELPEELQLKYLSESGNC